VGRSTLLPDTLESAYLDASPGATKSNDTSMWRTLTTEVALPSCASYQLVPDMPSRWSCSSGKRLFDVACIFLFLPIILPISAIVALAVRLTSPGPILFLQERMGREGKRFKILKFRTMSHLVNAEHFAVTTNSSQQITRAGLFLRRWKLDELPQLLNVLLGDMSLVGARPKVPEHQCGVLHSRPGITGAATLAFAREGASFDSIPSHQLQGYYRDVILPIKWRLDVEYMSKASFVSDLTLIVKSVFRRWNHSLSRRLQTGPDSPMISHRTALRSCLRKPRCFAPRWSCIACKSVPSELMNQLRE
jgi:lipopolysaccharide/colanic/teichoic acid biosynthesis glycosyltransferase